MRRIRLTLQAVLCYVVLLTACTQSNKKGTTETASLVDTAKAKVERYGMITGLKPEKMAYYKKLHAAVWPAF
jgi:L-rhamnose mutarotase